MIEIEKLLKYYILEYCSLIINHKTSLDSIPDEKGVAPCLRKGFSFKFKKVKPTTKNFLNLLYSGKDEPISYFHFKYDYMEAKECSAPVRDLYNCTFLVHNKDGTVVDFAIAKGTWTDNFFKDIQKKLETIGYLPLRYISENPLVSYCTTKQHELMGGNYSSLAITKESLERFTSEFCALINDSSALESIARDQMFKPASEDFSIRHDNITYPFKLRYVCDSNCYDNNSYVELYPYNFDGNSLKFTINNTDKNFSLFMNIRDSLREISKKGEHYLNNKKRESIKKSCDKFEKDRLTRVEKKHEKADLNMTNNKNLHSVIDHITNSNRTNGITPHYLNSTNISTPDLTHFNKITNTNPPNSKNSTWLTPLIVAGIIISLVGIGIFALFKRKRSRNKDQSFDLKSKGTGNDQEHSSFIPPISATVQADSANQERTEVLENSRSSNTEKKEFQIHSPINLLMKKNKKEYIETFKRTNTRRLAPLAEVEEFEDEYDGDIILMMTAGNEPTSNALPLSYLNGDSISIESSIPDSIYSRAEGVNLIGIRCASSSTISRL